MKTFPLTAVLGLWTGIQHPGGFVPVYQLGCHLIGDTVPDTAFGTPLFVDAIRLRLVTCCSWLDSVPTWFQDRSLTLADIAPHLERLEREQGAEIEIPPVGGGR